MRSSTIAKTTINNIVKTVADNDNNEKMSMYSLKGK
jgi:hypothetical protein